MGPPDDDVPYRPPWVMPDALEQLLREFDETAEVEIRVNWRRLSSTQRDRFWQELTNPRLRRTRQKRALLIAEVLLGSAGSADIPGQGGPPD